MPADKDEKTEAPTPRRRTEARDSGQVAKSQDLGAAVLLLGGMVALEIMGQDILRELLNALGYYLGGNDVVPVTTDQIPELARYAAKVLAGVVLPLMVVLVILALLVQYFQVGLLLTLKPLTPDLGKLNPIKGAARLFSMSAFVRLGMSLLKLGIIGAVAYVTLREQIREVVFAINLDHWLILGLATELVFSLSLRLGIILLILGIIDYAYQRYKHERDLKMTKQEVKEEMRRMEGDPIVKQRQRSVQMQLTKQRLRADVPKADVVVTNPTELAIAIKYDSDTMDAPRVLAKGQDFLARQIRQIAIEYGVPIVERKPLAQALYRTCEVGDEIPPQFYKAVAEVLAYVYELSGQGPRRRPEPVGV